MLTSSPRRGTRPAWAAGHPCTPLSPCGCILPAPSSSSPPSTNVQPLSSPHTPAAMGLSSHSSEPSACFPQGPKPGGQRLLSIPVLLGSGSITDHKTFFFFLFFFPTFSFVKQKVFVYCQEGLRQICHGPFLWLPLPAASPSLAFWPLACCNPFPAPGFSLSLPCWRASNPLPPSRRLLRGTPVSSLQLTAGFICPQGLVFIRHHAARRCGGFRPSHYPAFQH